MLFNNVELKVFNFESEYCICAKTKNEAIKYHSELVSNGDEWEVRECDLEKEGVYTDSTLDYIFETIKKLKEDENIKISKINDTWYIWTSFKNLIEEHIKSEGIEKISSEPYQIAWNEY